MWAISQRGQNLKRVRNYRGACAVAGLLAAASGAGVAQAQEATPTTVSFNVAVVSDYVFRGISQTDKQPTVQGGVDVTHGVFYAGAWASGVDFGLDEEMELDFYAGVKPVLGPVTLDLGVIWYSYPGLDGSAHGDYLEAKAGASMSPMENLTVGATLFYSPEFTFTDGESAYYGEVSAAYNFTPNFVVSGALGYQDVQASDYYFDFGDGDSTDNYTTVNLGATYTEKGFSLDGRYYDTDLDTVEVTGPSGKQIGGKKFVGTLKFGF